MAQTAEYWQNKMLVQVLATPALSTMTSPSMVAIFRLLFFIVGTCINMFEQVLDIFKYEVEEIAAEAVPGTDSWVQNEVFKFQYSATTPQVVQLVNFVPGYATIDNTLKLASRCSVKTQPTNKVVSIKVAKSEPPAPFSAPELTSLRSYLDKISFAGVQYSVVSLNPDKLYIVGNVYYDGAYAAVISANVVAAINAYLSALPFNGIIRVNKVIDAIQSVAGVTDVTINDMALRAHATLFANKTFLVQGYDLIFNKYPTTAGYIVEETTGGADFATNLTFIVEP